MFDLIFNKNSIFIMEFFPLYNKNKENSKDFVNLKGRKAKIVISKRMKNNNKIILKSNFFIIVVLLMTTKYYFFIYSFEYIYKVQGINYLKKCMDKLNKSKTISSFNLFNLKEYPKITVIIPVYNCQESIKLTLISILNQNIPEFEIILINDNSNDNSSIIINDMKKYDNRIKLINNLKNMGTLYSRCIGALNAKGKYIFSLDNDDIFLNEDIFKKIYNIAKKLNFDIVEFKAFDIPNYQPKIKDIGQSYFNFHPNNLILYQPELSIFPISKNNEYFSNDNLIWGKCIKTKLYQISVNSLGTKRYSIYNCWTEDISIILVIFNLANSYIFLNKYGIFHLNSNITSTFTLHQDHKIFSEIYLLDIIIDYLKKTENNTKLVIFKTYDIFNKIKNNKLSQVNKNYLKLVLQKIQNYQYINQKEKQNLAIRFNEFLKY